MTPDLPLIRYERLLVLRDRVTALLPDLRDENGCCLVYGQGNGEPCTDDCTAAALQVAYRAVSPRRVPGRPAGQRIAEEPTAEAREVLGLALTNCETCRHDYPNTVGGRDCARIAAILATEEDADELFAWTRANVDDLGAPKPGATGCPDHAPREVPRG